MARYFKPAIPGPAANKKETHGAEQKAPVPKKGVTKDGAAEAKRADNA